MVPKFMIGLSMIGAIGILGSVGCHHRHWGHHRHMSAEDVNRIADRIASKLDMDDAQKEKMRALSGKISAKLPEMQSKRKEMSSAAIRQFESESFNTQEVSGIMSEHEKSMRGMHDFMVASLAEFHAILTPEQRTKVAAFMKKWSDRGIH